jgi:nucleotide-binding universal stress UspA family protein
MLAVETSKRIALKNILFATDFSTCSNVALPYAKALCQRYGATLHSIHVRPTTTEMVLMSPEIWPMWVEEEANQTNSYIAQLEEQLREVPHEVLTPKGKAADAIAEIVGPKQIDLLVLGSHGRAGIGKLFLGSIAEEILRRVACPVLSVGPRVLYKASGEIRLQQILFPTDFSPNSLAALPIAISLADEHQANLTLLHVVEEPAAAIIDLDAVKAALVRRLHQLLPSGSEASFRSECALEFGQRFAPPAERILEAAKERKADLIVLGVQPVRGKFGFITHLASTTAQILSQSACPVLTVRGESE